MQAKLQHQNPMANVNKFLGLGMDARSMLGMFSRGRNVYRGGVPSSHNGRHQRSRKLTNPQAALRQAMLRRMSRGRSY